jgi:hypothetical protein
MTADAPKPVISESARSWAIRMAHAVQAQINASVAQLEPDARLARATEAVEHLAEAYDDGSAAHRLTAQIEAISKRLALVESMLARFIMERDQAKGSSA